MKSKVPLKDLLSITKDGEWGKGEPASDLTEMSVIRGTDFAQVRLGSLQEVPTRYIPDKIAARKQLQPEDILIETAGGSKNRPTGRTVYLKYSIFEVAERPITCASFSRFLRVDRTLAHPEFVYWYLQHLYASGQMEAHQVQHTGIARFQYTKFAETTLVPLPPLHEQQAIASILGSLDDKIELNRRMNETLEALARTLFKSWFVGFDPVRAKMEGRQPYGMDDETAALFPDSFEDSVLGEIPKGWSVGAVADDFDVTMGQSPPGETYNEVGEGLPFYQGRRDFKFRYPDLRVYCSAPKRTAKSGDALVSVRAPVGDVNMAESVCCVGRGVAAVRHKTGSRSYTYYAMRSLKSYFERFESEGTVFGAVNKQGFMTIPFLLPPPALVDRFEAIVFPLDQRIEAQEKQSRTLAAIRDALLPKLLSGEVRVSEAEEVVEEMA